MKTPKMNIMSKKNKKQNNELIERIKEIQSQIAEIQSEAGIVVEESDIVFTREQLENFLVEYTNKVNQYIFDEMVNSLDSDEIVTVDVDLICANFIDVATSTRQKLRNLCSRCDACTT